MTDAIVRSARFPFPRATLASVWVGAIAVVIAWLSAEKRMADLDAAANGVLATASGANDQIANARLDEIFGQVEVASPLAAGFQTGAPLAVVAALTVTLVVIGRRRALSPGVPVRGATWILAAVGIALLVASVPLAVQGAESSTANGSQRSTAQLVELPVAHGLVLAGCVAVLAAVVIPAFLGGRRAARAAGALLLAGVFACGWIAVVGAGLGVSAEMDRLMKSGVQAGNSLDVLLQRQIVIATFYDVPPIAVGLALIAVLVLLAVSPRRPR